jgi:hypothetical protein
MDLCVRSSVVRCVSELAVGGNGCFKRLVPRGGQAAIGHYDRMLPVAIPDTFGQCAECPVKGQQLFLPLGL